MNRPLVILSTSLAVCLIAAPLASFAAEATAKVVATAPQDAEAEFQLARAHLTGKGAAKDPAKAYELMQAAAKNGHAEALGGVGYFYANGVAVAKDEAQAVDWFRKGAEKGGPRSMFNLGRMLLDGKGVAKDEAKGREWMKKSADKEVPEAMEVVASMYLLGDHGEKIDPERAYPYALAAAEHGLLDAQNMVGLMLCDGMGVAKDRAAGLRWYRQAAAAGHVKAQCGLGMALGPFDRKADRAERLEALAWLFVAAGNDSVMAKKALTIANPDPAEIADARKKAAELRPKAKSSTPALPLRQAIK